MLPINHTGCCFKIPMLQTLHHRHHRSLSMAFVAVMLLSVLQFCLMNMAEGPLAQHQSESLLTNTSATSEQTLLVSAIDSTHDCCVIDSASIGAMEAACPDCENDSQALQILAGPDLKPLFTLLYVVVQEVLNQTLYARLWQQFTEPDILSSLPDIYLAKASFLE
ncbi:hypothetical protein [Endozoicomonas sp.]|uniref:hypothetical protein n=1 Tax=Endozoicomonas sp. TaxID=1892382 RepID=UPI0028861BFE|nr:hypothetical protein [Endozoicomonas sp.]